MPKPVATSDVVETHEKIKFYVDLSLTPVQITNSIKPLNDNLNMSPKDIYKKNWKIKLLL